jgi:hypothetical protein
MRRPRSERIPVGTAGIWHITSRCVRRERLLEAPGARAWLADAPGRGQGVVGIGGAPAEGGGAGGGG